MWKQMKWTIFKKNLSYQNLLKKDYKFPKSVTFKEIELLMKYLPPGKTPDSNVLQKVKPYEMVSELRKTEKITQLIL